LLKSAHSPPRIKEQSGSKRPRVKNTQLALGPTTLLSFHQASIIMWASRALFSLTGGRRLMTNYLAEAAISAIASLVFHPPPLTRAFDSFAFSLARQSNYTKPPARSLRQYNIDPGRYKN
jgi:hypothetical protein